MTTPIILQSAKFISMQCNGYKTTTICKYLFALAHSLSYKFAFLYSKTCVQQLKLVVEFSFDLTANVSFWLYIYTFIKMTLHCAYSTEFCHNHNTAYREILVWDVCYFLWIAYHRCRPAILLGWGKETNYAQYRKTPDCLYSSSCLRNLQEILNIATWQKLTMLT